MGLTLFLSIKDDMTLDRLKFDLESLVDESSSKLKIPAQNIAYEPNNDYTKVEGDSTMLLDIDDEGLIYIHSRISPIDDEKDENGSYTNFRIKTLNIIMPSSVKTIQPFFNNL